MTDVLFTATQLGNLLGVTVSAERHEQVELIVWGWLRPALAVEERPEPVTPELYARALELGAIAHENPAGLDSQQLGSNQKRFSSERRQELLGESESGSATSRTAPRGCFPPARPYPDPAW